MKINSILQTKDFSKNAELDHINQLWRAIMNMDLIELYWLLNDKTNFGGLSKQQFVEILYAKIEKHKKIGDREFYLDLIECHNQHKHEIICEFVGLESGINLGIYFKIEGEKLTRLQFCECFGRVEDLDDENED